MMKAQPDAGDAPLDDAGDAPLDDAPQTPLRTTPSDAPTKIRVRVDWKNDEIISAEFLDSQIWIGRSPNCDLIIEHPSFSRYHALLERRAPGRYTLRNLQSLNGLQRDGRRIESWNLNDGDVIHVGEIAMTFSIQEAEADEESATASAAVHAAALFGATITLTPETQEKAIKERCAKALGWLKPAGEQSGEAAAIDRDAFTVGSSVLADFRILDRRFPEWCAVIVREPAGFSVHNVSPTEKSVRVNRRRVSGWVALGNSNVLEFGDREFVFYVDSIPAVLTKRAEEPTSSDSKPRAQTAAREQAERGRPEPAIHHDWTRKPPVVKPIARVSRRFKRPPKPDPKSSLRVASRVPPWVKIAGAVVWGLALVAFFVKVLISLAEVF